MRQNAGPNEVTPPARGMEGPADRSVRGLAGGAAGPAREGVRDVRPLTVLWFGTYDREGGRNALLIEGLRAAGVEVLECHAPLWRDTADKLAAAADARRALDVVARQLGAWVRLEGCHARVPEYDVLVVGATAHLDLPLARLLSGWRGRPLVFDPLVSIGETVRDRGLIGPGIRLQALAAVEGALFRLPDRVLADTAAHAVALGAEVGLDPGRAVVLPAGAPAVYRRLARPYAPSAGRLRVVYFGQFIPLHGLDVVLRAADRLRGEPGITFDLVGVGQTLDETRALALALALPNVRFHPEWLPPVRLSTEHIAGADLCLGVFGATPKAARVVPHKVFTALAAGRPVLTADTPAVRELLRPGEMWTVPPGDPEALAAALIELAYRPGTRATVAAAGQAAWDERFAPPVLGARLHDALVELCEAEGVERSALGPVPARVGSIGIVATGGGRFRAPANVADRADPANAKDGSTPYVGPRHRWRVAKLADALHAAAPAGPLLDAGCGDGTLAVALALAGRTVYAFDRDPARLARAATAARAAGVAERVRFMRGDITSVPLPDRAVAGVAAGEVLEHIADDGAAAAELARVLVPGGALAVTVPAGARRLGPTDRAVGHHRRYDEPDLARLLTGAGLALERLDGWGFPFGRAYDRLVLGPATAARGGPAGDLLARLGREPAVSALWLALFDLDDKVATQIPAGGRGSGWLAVARRWSA